MKRTVRRVLSLGALVALVAVPTMLPALAQSGSAAAPTRIQHRQSVLTQVDPTGAFESAIVVTQLLVSGNGTVEVSLPDQATAGLRNLEGFDRPSVADSTVTWSIPTSPSGALRRTVADADVAKVPVKIEIVYELDGETVTPSQLVGRSGFLTATYTVTNLTAEEREVRYFDGQGAPRTATVEVAVPMGGTFSTTLDSRFVNVESAQATGIAGDGQGNTVVNGGFTLFAPAGESTQSFSWSAYVTDAVVPAAEITILPVSSRSNPSVGSGQAQLEQLIDGFKNITNGGLILNSNVLRLAEGAAAAADGAGQLADGLANTAAPGAQRLADGLKAAGEGAATLSNGAYLVADGVKDLRFQVYGDEQLLEQLINARGFLQTSLLGSGETIESLPAAGNSIWGICMPPTSAGGAYNGGRLVELATEVGNEATSIGTAAATIAIATGSTPAGSAPFFVPGTGDATVEAQALAIFGNLTEVGKLMAGTGAGAGTVPGAVTGDTTDSITEIIGACATAAILPPPSPNALYAYAILTGPQGLYPASTPREDYDGAVFKLEDAESDVIKLQAGGYAVADGATELAKGIIDTAGPGAAQLADGLGDAADGAGQLAEGVETIAGGTQAVSDAISGTLVAGTTEGAADLGLRLAQLNAADARGIDNEGLPYGTVAGADVSAVYAFEIAGVGGESGPSSATLALAALIALGLAALVGLALRNRAG